VITYIRVKTVAQQQLRDKSERHNYANTKACEDGGGGGSSEQLVVKTMVMQVVPLAAHGR